jgi:cytochrome c553
MNRKLVLMALTLVLVAISVAPAFAGKADLGPPYGVHKPPAFDNASSCTVCHGGRIGPPYGVHKPPAFDNAASCVVCHPM